MKIIRYLALRGKTLRGMTILHVGAHRGQEAGTYQKWGAARVIWVEAIPAMAEALKSHLADVEKMPRHAFALLTGAPKTEHSVIEALVGDEDGKLTEFHLFSNDAASSSIFTKSDGAAEKFKHVKETGEVLEIKMQKLDSALKANGIDPSEIDVMVLDVQGAELLCLKGATETLRTLYCLETEVSKQSFYEGGVLLPELSDWLSMHGFQLKTRVRKWHQNAIFAR